MFTKTNLYVMYLKAVVNICALLMLSVKANAALQCEFSVTQSWGSGGNAQIAITNTGETTANVDPFTAEFTSGISIGSSWHTDLNGNNPYTFIPRNWNNTIGAGQTRYFGFSLNGPVSSSTTAALGGACGGGGIVNNPPVANLSCSEVVAVPGAPPNGFFVDVEYYSMNCVDNSYDPDLDSPTEIARVDWGDGTVNTSLYHQYIESGTYTITLTVTDGELTDSDSVTIAATGNTLPPTANINCEILEGDGQTVVCDASGSTDPNGDVLQFAWNWGDGTGNTGETAVHTYPQWGAYTVSVVVGDGHNTAYASQHVIVGNYGGISPALTDFSVATTGRTVEVDVPFQGSAGISVFWYWGDGSDYATGAPRTHTYAQAGTYSITLTLLDEAGNIGQASREVDVGISVEPAVAECSWASRSNFTNGFVYQFLIRNITDAVLSNWQVCFLFDQDSMTTNLFGAERPIVPLIVDDGWECFGPTVWNNDLAPNQATSFGFIGSGPGEILDVAGSCNSIEQ